MTNLARFKITGSVGGESPSTDRGYDAVHGEDLTFNLEAPSAVINRVTYQVFDDADPDSPLSSKDAPELLLDNGVATGQSVDATAPTADVDTTMPAAPDVHSWIVRCLVNGGINPRTGQPDGDYVFERLVTIRTTAGTRKVIAAEGTQYSAAGWADAQNEQIDAAGAYPSVPLDPGDDDRVWTASGGAADWALIANANVDAAAAIAGSKIDPDFGSQDIITTGGLRYGGALSGPIVDTREGQTTLSSAAANTVLSWDPTFTLGNDGQLTVVAAIHARQASTDEFAWCEYKLRVAIVSGVVTAAEAAEAISEKLTGGATSDGWTFVLEVSSGAIRVTAQNPAWASSADNVTVKAAVEYMGSEW